MWIIKRIALAGTLFAMVQCGGVSNDAGLPPAFPADLSLVGDSGSLFTGEDATDRGVLLVFIDQESLERLAGYWRLTDFESDAFKVALVGIAEDRDELIEAKRAQFLNQELYFDESGALTVASAPGYWLFPKDGKPTSGSGLPPLDLLYREAVAPHYDPSQVAHFLGQSRVVLQQHKNDCAAAAVSMMLDRMNIPVSVETVYEGLDKGPDGDQVSLLEIKQFLGTIGIQGSGWRGAFADLKKETRPVILHLDQNHFVVMSAVMDEGALILDPSLGRQFLTPDDLQKRWKGVYFRVDPI